MSFRYRPQTVRAAVAVTAAIFLTSAGPVGAGETARKANAPSCAVPADLTRLDRPLARTARRLAAGEPLTIVAIGSSSTAGAGASSPAASYPSRLEVELKQRFPQRRIAVINRGTNGEDAREMLARFEQSVMAENPDLVLWQVGTNSLLFDRSLDNAGALVVDGLGRLKAKGVDVVLIDPQFAPKVLAKPAIKKLMDIMSSIAKRANIATFHRFAVMRHWREVGGVPFSAFLSPDELHMNDWSYACVAKLLAGAIADAATRSTVTAEAPALQRPQ